jgi:hypothetical protein
VDTASTAAAVPAPLTREDSLAIAAAIERKFAEQRAAARAQMESTQKTKTPAAAQAAPLTQEDINREVARIADSLRVEIQKSVLDSVTRVRGRPTDIGRVLGTTFTMDSLGRSIRLPRVGDERAAARTRELPTDAFAERAANLGPPRRVFIATPRLRGSQEVFAPAVDSLADSLRRTIARNPRFIVIDGDSTRSMLERTRTINVISDAMKVELFASVYINAQSDSSVAWTVTMRDLSAHPLYAVRGMGVKSDPGAPLSAIDKLVARSVQHLAEMDRAPRKPGSTTLLPRQ